MEVGVVNTSFEYLYRDAANYKVFETVVLQGHAKKEHFSPFLHEGDFFIPSRVGLRDLQPDVMTELDHVWHEIVEVLPTDEESTVLLTADELISAFRTRAGHWQNAPVERFDKALTVRQMRVSH